MKRQLILVGVTALLSSCSWADYVNHTIPIHYFDNKTLPAPNNQHAGFANLVTDDIYIDEDCSGDGVCLDQLGDTEFWLDHERGHQIYKRIGYPFGRDLFHQEYGANVVACVVTGHQPNFEVPDQGYLNCKEEDIATVKHLMETNLHIDDLKG